MVSGLRYFQKRIEFLDRLKCYKSKGNLTISEIELIRIDMNISKTLVKNLLNEFYQYKILTCGENGLEIMFDNILEVPQYLVLISTIELLYNHPELRNKNVISETELAMKIKVERNVIQRAKAILSSVEHNT